MAEFQKRQSAHLSAKISHEEGKIREEAFLKGASLS